MTYPSSVNIGRCIRMAHTATGKKHREVCKAIRNTKGEEMSPQSYSQIIDNDNPKIKTVMEICHGLGLTIGELLSYGNNHNSDRREESQEL